MVVIPRLVGQTGIVGQGAGKIIGQDLVDVRRDGQDQNQPLGLNRIPHGEAHPPGNQDLAIRDGGQHGGVVMVVSVSMIVVVSVSMVVIMVVTMAVVAVAGPGPHLPAHNLPILQRDHEIVSGLAKVTV